jgi:hypothetical protein
VVFTDGGKVCFARSTIISSSSLRRGSRLRSDYSRHLSTADCRPDITKSDTIRVGIGIDPLVILEHIDDIVDECVDLGLVGAWCPGLIFDAGELE